MPSIVNKYIPQVLIVVGAILALPIIATITEIIYHYGTFIGTFIRNIAENGACF